jgi:hypothetical protein
MQALQLSGWAETKAHAVLLFSQVKKFQDANSLDEKEDLNDDGIADCEQMDNGELVRRCTLS